MTIAHVGDSRLYRLRKGRIEQVTKDHSLLQRLIDQGFYTPEEASQSNNKNYVTRAMGVESEVEVELQQAPVLPGDTYLMCSDGLSDLVAPETLQSVLQGSGDDLKTAADTLVRLANEAGGKDNISVILARVSDPPRAGDYGNAPVTLADGIEIHGVSDVGIKRSHNEDYIGTDPDIHLAILCDGMGGYNAGEIASALAVNTIMDHLRKGLGLAGAGDRAPVEGDAILEQILMGDGRDEGGLPEISDEYTELVSRLQVGTWIEFRRGDDTVKRAQLTWISPSGSALLFTDRQGAKVADATPTGLAVELRRGTAAVIGDVPLFDRAVDSVMSHLKEGATAPA
jgi:serine/threonine protein phosphatase PrpC